MTPRGIDMRLWRIGAELHVLERYLELIEKHIAQSKKEAECAQVAEEKKLSSRWSKEDWSDLSSDAWADLDFIRQEYEIEIDFIQPRMLRGPCLVVLYSVYESAVTYAADSIQSRKDQKLSITDIRKQGFLERAKMYYGSVLHFNLSESNERWRKLILLSKIRNIIAHENGYIGSDRSARIVKLLKEPGVSEKWGCLLVSRELLRELYTAVKEELESLERRYKEWDDERRNVSAQNS